MKYSIIVAVFNRPDELGELLESLTHQTYRDFEVVIVEDGSTVSSKSVCDAYASQLKLSYYAKPNSGPGPSRNYGCRRAAGDCFIFLDSDCTVPPDYMQAIDTAVVDQKLDAFGGPDREHASFTPTQKAISYSMTSLLTTGGIRGSKVRVGGAFHPRSFNMGISRAVFNDTEGFSGMRFGEEVEFSIRMMGRGYRVALIPDSWVYHKRRTNLKKFFKQVHNSGIARINITLRHPQTLKLTHFFPAGFTTYFVFALVAAFTQPLGQTTLLLPAIYTALLFIEGSFKYRNPIMGLRCVAAAYVQLIGYGTGFIRGIVWRVILNKPEQGAFEKTFYS